jgi:hypothetical protein
MDKTVATEVMPRQDTVKEVTEAQRELVRHRLAEYHANPDEPVATLADIKCDLVCLCGEESALLQASSLLGPRHSRGAHL